MSFHVYKLINKLWGRIWGQGDQNEDIWVKIE